MSREIDNTGKVIVCDDIVATSRRKTQSGVDDVLSQLNGSSAFTAGQKQFSKDFSLSLSGNFKATGSVPATLKLEIYRNGTKLDVSNPAIKGSSILWESLDGTFRRFGEYTAVYEQSISLNDLVRNTEQFKVTWTSRDSDSVPLTASVNVSVGEKVEYALSKYLDSSKVATDSIVWFDTISGALGVSHPYSCYLWTRSSSTYDFVNKEYVDWKYFKGELYYEGKTVDDTAGDMIDRLNKYIEFSSSSDRFTVDHKSIGSDTLRFEVNVNGYSDVSYLWNNNAGLIVDESKKTESKFTVSIPHDNNYDSVVVFVTVTYTDEGETKTIRHDFELTPINVTKPESYLGVLNSIPSGDYIATTESKAIAGDWFVLKSTNTMYVLDFSYTDSETGSHWKPFTGDMDSSWPLEKVADAMFDMIEIGNTSNTNATMIGVFKALCANSAFIKFLKTRNLTVESSSGNFKFYVKTTNDYGEDLVNPIVEVWYNGTIIFKINPENGNIFFGTPNLSYTAPVSGFMYDATTKRIVSNNENIIIYENGSVLFSGYINSKSIKNVEIEKSLRTVSDISSFDALVSSFVELGYENGEVEAEGELEYNGTIYQIKSVDFLILPQFDLIKTWSQKTYYTKTFPNNTQRNVGYATIAQAQIAFGVKGLEESLSIYQRKIHLNAFYELRSSTSESWQYQAGKKEYYPLPSTAKEYKDFEVSSGKQFDGYQLEVADVTNEVVYVSDFDKYQPSASNNFTLKSLYLVEDFKEALFINNLPTFKTSEQNRVWKDSNGFLRIS